MMILEEALFLQLMIIQVLGLNANINVHVNEQGPPVALDHSWEAQHFLNRNSVVEGESDMDELVALRERRDSMKPENGNNDDEVSGSADICQRNEHGCHRNATCISYMNNKYMYNCTCNEGFSGDGNECEDIDECSIGTHNCRERNSNCTNSYGSYNCVCEAGYVEDGHNCKDIDECSIGTHNCRERNSNCTNSYGSYNCVCEAGYVGDGHNCKDIDECSTNPCSPNAQCNNTMGSFECTCNETFYGDGVICTELRPDYSSRNVYIKPGDPAVLVCSLNQTVQWKRDGKIIINNENIKIYQNVLVVNSGDDKDYGEYFCELTNYKGKGIKMRLIKVNEDTSDNGDGESKTYLILFIVALILLVFALFAISYLLLRRKPNLASTIQRDATARRNEYGESNEIFMTEIAPGETEEENYNTLSELRDEEPTYQSLLVEIGGNDDPESLYEDVPVAQDKQNPPKNDEHVYAEPK